MDFKTRKAHFRTLIILLQTHMTQKKRKKWPLVLIAILGLIVITYLLGPKASKPDFTKLVVREYSSDLRKLEDSIKIAEAYEVLKPDNEARIIWALDHTPTEYSMVYLHGNGASQEEGDPIHEALAHRYGCNLFLARLSDHGIVSDNPMKDIKAEEWMQSALDALMVGRKLGQKVILVSCSTGSTLALYLASRYPDLVDGHIMLSPNVDVYDPRSALLVKPYGLQIARKITGSEFYGWKAPGPAQSYWYTRYRIEALCTLKSIINETMTEATFRDVKDPVLMLYYYRDDDHQDDVVSVKRMKEMFSQLGTPANQKQEYALADANTHIIGSDIFNPNLESVWQPSILFCEKVLNLQSVNNDGWRPFLDRSQN